MTKDNTDTKQLRMIRDFRDSNDGSEEKKTIKVSEDTLSKIFDLSFEDEGVDTVIEGIHIVKNPSEYNRDNTDSIFLDLDKSTEIVETKEALVETEQEKVKENVDEALDKYKALLGENEGKEAPKKQLSRIERNNYKQYKTPFIKNIFGSKEQEESIELEHTGEEVIDFLKNFNISANLIDIKRSPRVTRYIIQTDPKIKLSKLKELDKTLATQFGGRVSIVAPILGTQYCGIDISNMNPRNVDGAWIFNSNEARCSKDSLDMFIGVNNNSEIYSINLRSTGHILVSGATGTGKTKFNDAVINNVLLRSRPDEVKLLLIDTKKIIFNIYHDIPHLISPIISDAYFASNALKVIVQMMEERYNVFSASGVRNIEGFNEKVKAQGGRPNDDGSPAPKKLPYVVVIIDELADLMNVAGKDVESSIQRITQLARAAGIHLIVATQRPSVNVITGVIKSNIPSRIAFAVSSGVDSRTILDSVGAERLLGNGDMLYQPIGQNAAERVQGVFVTDAEVAKITEDVKKRGTPEYDDHFIMLDGVEGNMGVATVNDDPMFEEVKEYVIQAQKASTSLLQRRFGIGYNRAARMIDALEESGVIGPAQGSKPREVFMKPED